LKTSFAVFHLLLNVVKVSDLKSYRVFIKKRTSDGQYESGVCINLGYERLSFYAACKRFALMK